MSYSNSYYYFSEQLHILIAKWKQALMTPSKAPLTFNTFAYQHSINLGIWIDSDFALSNIFNFKWHFIKVLWAHPVIYTELLQFNIL